MHILRVKTESKIKKIVVFWVTRSIKYTSLEYGLYKSWNIKVNCKMDVLDKIINFFKAKGILSKDWVTDNNACISMSLIKNHVKD